MSRPKVRPHGLPVARPGFRVLRIFRVFRVFRVFRDFRVFRVFRVFGVSDLRAYGSLIRRVSAGVSAL